MNFKALALLAAITLATSPADAAQREDAVLAVLNNFCPGSTGFGNMKVKKVTVSPAEKTIVVNCNETAGYIPLTAETIPVLKSDIRKALGAQYADYSVTIKAADRDLDQLVLFAPKQLTGPTETVAFITDIDAAPAPKGLDGSNIALWQSHGWYFEPKLNRWEWQRARVMQTVEDLYTQSYVMPYLMPMLENAGAYVMSPRERDTSINEYIIDADDAYTPGYSETNGLREWKQTTAAGFKWNGEQLINGSHPFADGTGRSVKTVTDGAHISTATWSIPELVYTEPLAVYISYTPDKNAATDAHYTVHAANGDRHFTVNQRMGAGTWLYLGHFVFEPGTDVPIVTLNNLSATEDAVVSADAVKVGGGMGVVSRIVKEPLDDIDYQYVSSERPKWVEGARYFLQWAGAPDSVFTPSDYVNDYNDDYRSRALWVNWLAGGSSQLPGQAGLGIPVDLSFAFHSDAGTFANDSIVGTLGIYCTKGDTLGNGDSRLASRDFTDLVMTEIVNDVRSNFEPSWTRRGMWDQSYYEARVPAVPSMLLELLSHQNFADMKYGLDPAFRFTVSRAIYKGMLKFLAHRDGREYVVQPLPIKDFAINTTTTDRLYTLTWEATPDEQEPTANPTYYIIEERVDDALGFTRVATVKEPRWQVAVSDTLIHSYRVIAANDGGVSFPSEVLALAHLNNDKAPVLVVNGFTRVSAPDWFEASPGIAGFYDERDHGVPYINDISYIGQQFEFRRDIPWMDDDAAGFGASRSDQETNVITGNTFDYPYVHGQAIVEAGHSFISKSVGAYIQSEPENEPAIVDLILGKQKEIARGRGIYGTYFKTFTPELQAKITAATEYGTSFFVSGAFVATDLWDNPHSTKEVAEADQSFATDVLGYHWRVGQAATMFGIYEVPCRFREFKGGSYYYTNFFNESCYLVESPDSFYAPDTATGCTFMRYTENNLVAGVANNFKSYRTVILGVPFESIGGVDDTPADLMSQILNFLSKK